MLCWSSVSDNTFCPAGSPPESHAAFPAVHLASSWLGPSGRPRQRTKRAIHPSRSTVDASGATRFRSSLFAGCEAASKHITSIPSFHYLKSHLQPFSDEILQQTEVQGWWRVQGSNLSRSSGEFHTDSPPHPLDHTKTFLWGQSTSNNRANGGHVGGENGAVHLSTARNEQLCFYEF